MAEIHVYQVDLPVSGAAYRMSMGDFTALDSTVVQVVSDTGVSGWGEICPIGPTYSSAHPLGARAALTQMGPGLIGTRSRDRAPCAGRWTDSSTGTTTSRRRWTSRPTT